MRPQAFGWSGRPARGGMQLCTEPVIAHRSTAPCGPVDNLDLIRLPSLMKTVHEFWLCVDRSGGPDACWPWTGFIGTWGYGQVVTYGTTRNASAVAYEIEHGSLPTNRIACHKCNNPPCCNPAHLYAGTHQDNADDRQVAGTTARGECNGRAKLTYAQVVDIRARYKPYDKLNGRVALAREFNVHTHMIHLIVSKKNWRLQ